MAKAVGIGGVFIHMEGDLNKLFDWYEKYLGLDFSAYGSGFLEGPQLMVLTFKRDDNPLMPYLNLRVDDIKEIINKMKQNKINIVSDIADYPYGKFATFKDPFGNVVELWEADHDAYVKMVHDELEKYKRSKKLKD